MKPIVYAALVLLSPTVAMAQTVPMTLANPYAMNNMSPSSGQSMTPHVGTTINATTNMIARETSQFSNDNANRLYGNYGSGYNPEVPNNVYGQDAVRSVPDDRNTPKERQ